MIKPMNIAVLGCTGSIGKNTLEVVAKQPERFNLVGLSAHRKVDELFELGRKFDVDWVACTDPESANGIGISSESFAVHVGHEPLSELVAADNIDCVVAAMVGSAGLGSTLAAVKAGKRVALANKETLVVAGGIVTKFAKESGAEILPVDSEHSAVFQALQAGKSHEVSKVILTASGGPFRDWPKERIAEATLDQALAHPTWKMGPKVTIDSATLMNKSLEIIEARWLFDLDVDRLDVMVHPQSLIHSMVEFTDGSVVAQMSPPDMKMPIQYALTYPDRLDGPARRMNWSEMATLELIPPDREKFPSLELGFEVVERGGTTGVVLNAANEAAVEAFVDGRISFNDIVSATRDVLNQHEFDPDPDLETLGRLDRWARQEISKWILA